MIRPVTIRLTADAAIVSQDDGATAVLPAQVSDALLTQLADIAEQPPAWTYDVPSAAARAGLAEASNLAPRDTSWVPAASDFNRGVRVRVADRVLRDSRALADLLDQRRSHRSLGQLDLSELGTVLVRTARLVAWRAGPDGVEERHKPIPSAGARHATELMVLASSVVGLDSGWWSFDSVTCELVRQGLAVDQDRVWVQLIESASLSGRPGAAIFVLARFDRTLARYPAGSTLVWRDAGVMLGTLHLCAADLGLGSCIVGLSGAVFHDENTMLADVGVLAVGQREA